MSTETDKIVLEACPFCGSALAISSAPINKFGQCPTDGCVGGRQAIVLDDPRQVTAWNRRSSPSLERVAVLEEALTKALRLKGGWREAIVELEDFCSEPVRLRNMIAAADQLDEWAASTRVVLAGGNING